MPETQSPINASSAHSGNQNTTNRPPFAFWIRVVLFVIVIVGCGWYSRFFQSSWTSFFPLTCASGSSALFVVEFDTFPARIGDQDNLCFGIGDGECQRVAADILIRGECRSSRMHGHWTVTDAKTGNDHWSGMYCDGLPCGDYRIRFDSEHENAFRVDKLLLDGPATIWERRDKQLVEFSGRYNHGKRVGPWVRRVEPSHTMLSTSIYDDSGFVTTTSYHCTNGNRKEIRGKDTFIYDAQGNAVAKSSADSQLDQEGDSLPDAGADDPAHCPLP
jgi:hypothetical protein